MNKKNIGIAITNKEQIEKYLNDIQHRSSARNVDYDDIVATCEGIEDYLELSKANLNGTCVTVNLSAQHFASSYNGVPMSTYFTVCYSSSSGWRLINAYRETCNASKVIKFELTDKAKEAITRRIAKGDWLYSSYRKALQA